MAPECVILIGLPAAGKTTFFRRRFERTHAYVSKDLLRNVRQPDRRQEAMITESLTRGKSVVVDNTNTTRAVRARLITLAKGLGATVTGYYFPAEAADALRRNRGRQGRERVPDVAIFAARKRLEPPSFDEGFARLFVVRLDERQGSFEVEPYSR
jgi:predicted kinase